MCGDKGGHSHEAHAGVAVDLSFEKHDEFVVQLAVKQTRPAPSRNTMQRQFRPNPLIKRVKDDVDHNDVGIHAIDPRRIDEIGTDASGAPVPPPLPLIGKEPPEILEQMRTGNGGNLVPSDGTGQVRWHIGR